MNAPVRLFASVIATLSAAQSFADVRPVPPGGGRPFPLPGNPGQGPGRPFPLPGNPGQGPGRPFPLPDDPIPGPGRPYPNGPRRNPPPALESYMCRDMQSGYDSLSITATPYARGGYVIDISAQNITMTGVQAYVTGRSFDSLLLQFDSPYGIAQINIGYLNHPYGPTAVLQLGNNYGQDFKCQRVQSSYPAPMPPSPYPSSPSNPPPFPYPHR